MPDRNTLRLLTWNVRGLRDDRDAVVRVLTALRPDVLCLQEVPRHPFAGHRVGALARDAELWVAASSPASAGTAILTSLRLDVRASGTSRLPTPLSRSGRPVTRRGVATATVRLPGTTELSVASLHLGLDAAERARHIAQLGVILRGSSPRVVAGDLNETPSGPSWSGFGPLRDVTPSGAPTFPAAHAFQRIDAVLADPRLEVRQARVPDERDGVQLADLHHASDHLPLFADFVPRPV